MNLNSSIDFPFLKKLEIKWLQPWWLNIPNLITILRIILTPFLFILIILNEGFGNSNIFSLFIVIALTDFFDGLLAKKLKAETKFGAEVDPWADKLLLGSIFVILFSRPFDYLWPLAFVALLTWTFAAEMINIHQRISKKKLNLSLKANYFGKWKCFLQMTAIGLLLNPYQSYLLLEKFVYLSLLISNLLITFNVIRSHALLKSKKLPV